MSKKTSKKDSTTKDDTTEKSQLTDFSKKGGRPRVSNEDVGDMVYQLASFGHTLNEIARIVKVDRKTIINNHQEQFQGGQDNLRISLRQKQIEKALNGDSSMLVWLGKQMLEQTNTPETAIQVNSGDQQTTVNIQSKSDDELLQLVQGDENDVSTDQ